jgi:predicted O-methyltransferase YrrM
MTEAAAQNFKRRLFHAARRVSNRLFGADLMHRSALARALWAGWNAVVHALSPAHRRQARFEREHPDAPWLVPESIPFIEGLLKPGMRGLEWGSGRSTLWLARHGLTLVSVEGRRAWSEQVAQWLARDGFAAQVELITVEVHQEYDVDAATIAAYADAPLRFLPQRFDFVMVDGHFRVACLQRVPQLLAPGGILVVDNADVADVQPQMARLEPYKIGDFDNAITMTRVYRAPADGLPPLD